MGPGGGGRPGFDGVPARHANLTCRVSPHAADGLLMLSPNAKLLAGGLMIGCGLALALASQLASAAGYVEFG